MRKKIKVAVLSGGKLPEHEISLISGREVVKNLSPQKYDVIPIVISKDGVIWQIGNKNLKFKIENLKFCDVVFITLHGPYGEDGTIQGFLELIGLPYTGSGVLASALGMDKISSRKLFTHAGLKVPNYLVLREPDPCQVVWQKFKPPVFVKPHNQGSSVGTSKVRKSSHLKKALDHAFSFSNLVLVEEFIDGIEITCPILDNSNPKALPLVEIVPKTKYFDYEAKYDDKLCDEIVPARISKSLTKKAQEAALIAYKVLGCRGFGRVDMIAKDNNVYILEVNTIPGLTPVSLFPKSAASIGISYPKLLDKIIMFALQR